MANSINIVASVVDWQPADTAPKETEILMAWEDGHLQIVYLKNEPSFWFENAPTHWAPLPAGPSAAPASPAALRDEADLLDDEAVDKELRRWQDAIRDKMISIGVPDSKIDGAGCDSGDPLDFTLAEVGQGVGYFLDQLEQLRAATTPQFTLAKPIAEEIRKYVLLNAHRLDTEEMQVIIERCLAGGGEDQKSTPTGLRSSPR